MPSFLSKHRDILNRWSLTFPIIIRQKATHFIGPMHDRRISCWRDSSSCREIINLFGDLLILNSAFTSTDRFRPFAFVVEPWTSFSRLQYQFTLRPLLLLSALLPRRYPLSLYRIISKPTQRPHSHRGLEAECRILEIEFYLLESGCHKYPYTHGTEERDIVGGGMSRALCSSRLTMNYNNYYFHLTVA